MAQTKFTQSPNWGEVLNFLNGLVDDMGTHGHPNMSGATTTSVGKSGFVPAPATGANNRYLRSDGTWSVPPDNNTTYDVVSQTAAGLVPQANGAKNNVLTGLGAWADISTLVSASTTGGIVAQSLGQNGYVKFANGLILQWGLISIDGVNVQLDFTYPLALTNVYCIEATQNRTDGVRHETNLYVISYNQTSAKILAQRDNNFILILGS